MESVNPGGYSHAIHRQEPELGMYSKYAVYRGPDEGPQTGLRFTPPLYAVQPSTVPDVPKIPDYGLSGTVWGSRHSSIFDISSRIQHLGSSIHSLTLQPHERGCILSRRVVSKEPVLKSRQKIRNVLFTTSSTYIQGGRPRGVSGLGLCMIGRSGGFENVLPRPTWDILGSAYLSKVTHRIPVNLYCSICT